MLLGLILLLRQQLLLYNERQNASAQYGSSFDFFLQNITFCVLVDVTKSVYFSQFFFGLPVFAGTEQLLLFSLFQC